MKNIKFISIQIVFLFLSNCMITRAYHSDVTMKEKLSREIRSTFTNPEIFRGVYSGKTRIDNIVFHQAQFESVLFKYNGFLNILLPDDPKKIEKIYESESKLQDSGTAFLIVEKYCCSKNKKSTIHLKKGDISDPHVYLDDSVENRQSVIDGPLKFINNEINRKKPVLLVFISLGGNMFSIHGVLWNTNEKGKYVFVDNFISVDDYEKFDIDIGWRKRSKTMYVLYRAGYIGTVLLDVVTSPVQLLILLGYGR